MKRALIVGSAATVLLSGGLTLAGVGEGTAHAGCAPGWVPNTCGYGPNRWCPGDSLYMDRGGPYQGVVWDMNVCHTWYRVAQGAGNVFEGPHNASSIWEGANPPPPAPPPPAAPRGLPPPPGMCWNMWIPGPCPGG
jgi:hypothetical protein